MAKAKNSSRKRSPLFVGLTITVLILFVIWLWRQRFGQVATSGFGALIWLGIFLVFFLFGLLYFGQWVLPQRTQDSWGDGFYLLLRPYLDAFDQIINATTQRRSGGAGPRDPSLAALPASFGEVRAGLLRSHQVLALARHSSFIRDAGSGFVQLNKGEIITHVIDLRQQSRSQAVQGTTRDGIPVTTAVSVTFQVRQENANSHDQNMLYPYDKDAIFRVSQLNSIGSENDIRPWTEQLCPQAAALFVTELAQYSLNQLFPVDSAGLIPLEEIKKTLQRELSRHFNRYGVDILGVGIRPLGLPPAILQQRIETWRADWERRIQMEQAAGNAEAVRRIRRARARAQIEIIDNILQNIDTAKRADNANLTKIVMLRTMDVLQKAVTEHAVQTVLPEEVISRLVEDASNKIHDMLDIPREQRHGK